MAKKEPEIITWTPDSGGDFFCRFKINGAYSPPIWGRSTVDAFSSALRIWEETNGTLADLEERIKRSTPKMMKEADLKSFVPEPPITDSEWQEAAPVKERVSLKALANEMKSVAKGEQKPPSSHGLAGSVWVVNRTTGDRKRISPDVFQDYIAKGYVRGKN